MATLYFYEFFGSQGGIWQGGDDIFAAPDYNAPNMVFGDVTETLEGSAQGGDDTLTGGDSAVNYIYGEALRLFDEAQGGDDTIIGGAYSQNFLRGESNAMHHNAQAGDDLLIGGIGSMNNMNGDAIAMYEATKGGNDTLIGGDGSLNLMRGDALFMNHSAQGGDDLLIGGGEGSTNYMYGDGSGEDGRGGLFDDSRGGNDTFIGGDNSTNYMYGDALLMIANSQGGDDRLVSGTGTDYMWGDAATMADNAQGGSDTFVFAADSGQDTVYDFEQGKDHLDLSALDLVILPGNVPAEKMPLQGLAGLMKAPPTVTGFEVLDSNGNGVLDDGDDYVSAANDGMDTVIDLGAAAGGASGEEVLTVAGVSALIEADFFF